MSRDGTSLRRVTSNNYYQASSPRFIERGKTLVFSAVGDYPDTVAYLFSVPADGSQKPKRLTEPGPGKARFAAWGSEPAVSNDGKLITFISDRSMPFRYDLFVMTSDGKDARPLGVTTVSRYNQKPAFVPDGKAVVFLAGTEWNQFNRPIFSLWKVRLDGSKPTLIADSKIFTDPLHWSIPTGSSERATAPAKP
jgi:Tol biopolymer transport system component